MDDPAMEKGRTFPPDLTTPFAIRPESAAWRPMCDGVDVAKILQDGPRDFSAMFLRFAPGSSAMRHVHPDGEQYWVISGSIEDENGRAEAGTFVNNPPGSVHTPRSDEGALVLITWFGRLKAYEG